MHLRELLGRNIGRLRLASGLSQEDLAHKAKIHRQYAGRIETGKANASVDTIQKLAKALRVRPMDLFEPLKLGRLRPPPLKKGPKGPRR